MEKAGLRAKPTFQKTYMRQEKCAVLRRGFRQLGRLFGRALRDMQREGEAASLPGLAGDAHLLAEVLHNFVSDGEAEAGALAVVGFIDLIEAVEHVGQIRCGNAHAGVADADADNVALRGRRSA